MSVVFRVETKSKTALQFIEFIKTLPFVKLEEPKKKLNKETIKAIEEVEQGKAEKLSLTEFRNQLYS
jgi:antitoxin component of RelBE/YafQ-DinJ toxin-antitoxin module